MNLTFYCNGCEEEKDFDHFKMMRLSADHKKVTRLCTGCRSGTAFVPDVYFDGKPEENLADDPATGKPRVFLSKGHKASYLKERGIVEAGDRVHGAPIMSSENQTRKSGSRHEAMMALKRVREMGIDVRRQEFLKIRKEGERHAER